MKPFLFRSFLIICAFSFLLIEGFSQVIGSRQNGAESFKNIEAATPQVTGLSNNVNLFDGSYQVGHSLGSVKTPGGLAFELSMSHSSQYQRGDLIDLTQGIPYGDGWNLNVPFVAVSNEVFRKHSLERVEWYMDDALTPNNDIDFTEAELLNEGEVVWHSIRVHIPGVVSETFVFKYANEDGEMVFAPNTFERHIEALFTKNNNWIITDQDGTQYVMATIQVSSRNAINQRLYKDSTNLADLQTDLDVMQQVLFPGKNVIKWHCSNIINPQQPGGQRIDFIYKEYGVFDYYKEYVQPDLQDIWHEWTGEVIPDLSCAKDILLLEVRASDVNTDLEKLVFNYETKEDIEGDTRDMLLRNLNGVEAHDDLYNKAIVYSQGVTGQVATDMSTEQSLTTNFNSGWRRYFHGMHEKVLEYSPHVCGDSAQLLNINNPYLFKGTGSTGYQSISWAEINNSQSTLKFDHCFLESPRIGDGRPGSNEFLGSSDPNKTNSANNMIYDNFPQGDLYEIRTYIDDSYADSYTGSTEPALRNCNFDINLVSGSVTDEDVSWSGGTTASGIAITNSTGLDYDTYYEINALGTRWGMRRSETVFSTFNQAVKWNSHSSSRYSNGLTDYLITSNLFVMPNLPSGFEGFQIQVGAANADLNYRVGPYDYNSINFPSPIIPGEQANVLDIYTNATFGSLNYGNELSPNEPIPNNFGAGYPWHMMRHIYRDMIYGDHEEVDVTKTTTQTMFKSWYNQYNNGQVDPDYCHPDGPLNTNVTWDHMPTRADENFKLHAVEVVRYSKNPFMLTSVEKYVTNGEIDQVSQEGRVLTDKKEFHYEVIHDEVNNAYSANAIPTFVINHNYTNYFLLKEIRTVPVDPTDKNSTPVAGIDYQEKNLPRILFEYEKRDHDFNDDLGNGFSNNHAYASGYLIEKITDPLGGTTEITYDANPKGFTVNHMQRKWVDHDYGSNWVPKTERPDAYSFTVHFKVNSIVKTADPDNVKPRQWDYLYETPNTINWSPDFTNNFRKSKNPSNGKRNYPYLVNKSGYGMVAVFEPELDAETCRSFTEHSFETLSSHLFGKLKKSETFKCEDPDPENQLNHIVSSTENFYQADQAFWNGNWRTQIQLQTSGMYSSIWSTYASEFPINEIDRDIPELDLGGGDKNYMGLLFPRIFSGTPGSNYSLYCDSYFIKNIKQVSKQFDVDNPITVGHERITDFEYWDADALGNPGNSGWDLLDPNMTSLDFEPSWLLYKKISTSPQLPQFENAEELFYYYDMLNLYDGVNATNSTTLNYVKEDRLKSLVAEQRVISAHTLNESQHDYRSTYFLYDDGWNDFDGTQRSNSIMTCSGVSGPLTSYEQALQNCTPLGTNVNIEELFLKPGESIHCYQGTNYLCKYFDPIDPCTVSNILPQNAREEYDDVSGTLLLKKIEVQVSPDVDPDYTTWFGNVEKLFRYKEQFSPSSFELSLPFPTKMLFEVNKRNGYGQVMLSTNERGTQTELTFNSPELITYWDNNQTPTVVCTQVLKYYNPGKPNTVTILDPSGQYDLVSSFNYTDNLGLLDRTDPNGKLEEFTHDLFGRLESTSLNGELLVINKYGEKDWDIVLDFDDHTNGNYVETILKRHKDTNDALAARSYYNPLGEVQQSVSHVLSDFTDPTSATNSIHNDMLERDNWRRSLLGYKSFEFVPPSGPGTLDRQSIGNSSGKTESQYENDPRSRPLKSATFGEDINTGHFKSSSYEYIEGSDFNTMTGLSGTGYTSTILPGTLGDYTLLKVTSLDEDSKEVITYTDALGRTVATQQQIQSGVYANTFYAYNITGQLEFVLNPENQEIHYKYNLLDKLFEEQQVDKGITRYMYDISGNVVLKQTEEQRQANQQDGEITNYTYDHLGRLTEEYKDNLQQPATDVTFNVALYEQSLTLSTDALDPFYIPQKYKYFHFDEDVLLNPSLIIHPDADIYLSGSNPQTNLLGNLSHSVTYSDNIPEEISIYSYNAEGLISEQIKQFEPNGISVGNYGLLNQVRFLSYDLRGSVLSTAYDHDLDGNDEFSLLYSYDTRSNLISIHSGEYLLEKFSYDEAQGYLTQKTYHHLNQVCGANTEGEFDAISYSYDLRNRLTNILGNWYGEELFYDGNLPTVPDPNYAINSSQNYNGNINAIEHAYGVSTLPGAPPNAMFTASTYYGYQYDGMNRLTDADCSDMDHAPNANFAIVGDANYSYDKVGNITTLTRNWMDYTTGNPLANNWTYNYTFHPILGAACNQLDVISNSLGPVAQFTYDYNGNLTGDVYKGIGSIGYYKDGLASNVTKGTKTNISYKYNSEEQRNYKLETFSGSKVREEYHLSKGVVYDYLSGMWEYHINSDIEYNLSQGFAYKVHDHLGSTRLKYYPLAGCIPGQSVQLLSAFEYLPYGKHLKAYYNPTNNRYQFTGQEKDPETGYDYFNARLFYGEYGRFLSVDALTASTPNWTPYRGLFDNPILYTDPSGNTEGLSIVVDDDNKIIQSNPNDGDENVYRGSKEGPIIGRQDRATTRPGYKGTGEDVNALYLVSANGDAIESDYTIESIVIPFAKPIGWVLKPASRGMGKVYSYIVSHFSDDVAEAAAKASTTALRNGHLAGKLHPVTKVPFTKSGFPNFSKHLYSGGKNNVFIKSTGTRAGDFSAANRAAGYTSTPKGFTWHHHQTTGRMQLVKSSIHSKTGHTGGFSIWGN